MAFAKIKHEYDWVVENRPIVIPNSYEEASERYIQDLKNIILDKSQYKKNKPVLMLSGGVDSMLLGAVLNKYFDFEDSITIGCVKDTDDIKVSQDTAEKLGINNKLIYCTWEEVIDSIKTENAQIIIKTISWKVGFMGPLRRKSIDKLPVGSNGLNQFIKSNGIAEMR